MNTARDIILKLVDEIPETKIGEVIDFILYLRGRKEQELYLEPEEEEEIWNLIKTDEKIPAEKVYELLHCELHSSEMNTTSPQAISHGLVLLNI